MHKLIASLSLLLAIFISSCAPGTDYQKRTTLSVGKQRVESAIDSVYFIPKGADVTVRYAKGSRFYVQKGATIRAFEKEGIDSMIIADDAANVVSLGGKKNYPYTRVRRVYNAESHYRGNPQSDPSKKKSQSKVRHVASSSSNYTSGGRSYSTQSSSYYDPVAERVIVREHIVDDYCPPRHHYSGHSSHHHSSHHGHNHHSSHKAEKKREFIRENKSAIQNSLKAKFKK